MKNIKHDRVIFENEKFIHYYMTYFKAIEKIPNDDIDFLIKELNKLFLTSEAFSNTEILAMNHLKFKR